MPRPRKCDLSKEFCITLFETQLGFTGNRLVVCQDVLGIPMPAEIDDTFIWPQFVKYFIGQLEKGENSEHVHLQAYIEFDVPAPITMVACKKHLAALFNSAGGNQADKAHIEVALGSRRTQIAYCTKSETRVDRERVSVVYQKPGSADETGHKEQDKGKKRGREQVTLDVYEMMKKLAAEGSDTPVTDAINHCLEALKTEEDAEKRKSLNSTIIRLENRGKEFEKYTREMVANVTRNAVKRRVVQVVVFFGPPGTGKTRMVMQRYGDSYHKKMPYCRFFGGYTKQKTLLLDDFKGEVGRNAFLTPEQLQHICEGWEYDLDVKNKDPIKAKWKVVAITTNLAFDAWYDSWFGIPAVIKESIRSRIPESCWIQVNGVDHRPKEHKKYPTKNLPIEEDDEEETNGQRRGRNENENEDENDVE